MAKLACIYSTKDKTWSMPNGHVSELYIFKKKFSKGLVKLSFGMVGMVGN